MAPSRALTAVTAAVTPPGGQAAQPPQAVCTARWKQPCAPRRAQGILSTGVISPAGVLYVSASTKNADGSVSWVRCHAPLISCHAPALLFLRAPVNVAGTGACQ